MNQEGESLAISANERALGDDGVRCQPSNGINRRPPKGGPMAALSPAHDNDISLCLVIFLTVLLALSLTAVITSPPQTDGPPAEGADAEPDLPKPAPEPTASPLPRRVAGQSGVAYPAGDSAHPPGVTRSSRVSGGSPWGPTSKPPGGGRHRRRAARRRP